MKKLFSFFFFFHFFYLDYMIGDPEVNLIIDHCIDPISGHYFTSEIDLIAPGCEKIVIERSYSSANQIDQESKWLFMPQLFIYFEVNRDKKNLPSVIKAKESSGFLLTYENKLDDRCTYNPKLESLPAGYLNSSKGDISSKTNIKNQKILKLEADNSYLHILPDGTKRYYKKLQKMYYAYLEKEQRPNGNWIVYEYDSDFSLVTKIFTTNPSQSKIYASVTFSYQSLDPTLSKNFSIRSHLGDQVCYTYEILEKNEVRSYSLKKVSNSFAKAINYDYQNLNPRDLSLLTKKSYNSHPIESLSYYAPGENEVGSMSVRIENQLDPIEQRVKTLEKYDNHGKSHLAYSLFYNLGQYPKKNKWVDFSKLKQKFAMTVAFDALGKKHEYAFDNTFIPIHYFRYGQKGSDPNGLLQRTYFFWEKLNNINYLKAKIIADNEKAHLKKLFFYDTYGNIIEEKIIGNITGKNFREISIDDQNNTPFLDEYSILSSYDQKTQHLICQKFPEGLTKIYDYLPNSDLKISEFSLDHGHIKLRKFYEYNDDLILIKTIEDDGSSFDKNDLIHVTYRKIIKYFLNSDNQIAAIEKKGWEKGEEKTLCLTHFFYDRRQNIIKEDFFDEKKTLLYTLYFDYDDTNKLIKKTDPKGRSYTYKYNLFGEQIYEKTPTSLYPCCFEKDLFGNTLEITRLKKEGKKESSVFNYDKKNRLFKACDAKGNLTEFIYDDLGYEIKKTFPTHLSINNEVIKGSIETKRDIFGNPVEVIDTKGHLIKTTYNCFQMPTKIFYPDGSFEEFIYSNSGRLLTHIQRNLICKNYKYDFLSRIIEETSTTQEGLILDQITYTYKGELLRESKTLFNVKTIYSYDAFQRKIEEKKEKNGELLSKTTYGYDCYGNLSLTVEYEVSESILQRRSKKTFDANGNILTLLEEDQVGKPHKKKEFFYDELDRIIEIKESKENQKTTEQFSYDEDHRVVLHSDKEYKKTQISYLEDSCESRTKISTKCKNKTSKIETFDSFERLIEKEILDESETLISKKEIFYDSFGQKILERVFYPQSSDLFEIHRSYDFFGNLIEETRVTNQNVLKKTLFVYNQFGQITEKSISPSLSLFYEYDTKGNLIHFYSTDQTINYQFVYDNENRLIKEINLLTKQNIYKRYDKKGLLTTEIFEGGAFVEKTYDSFDRKTSLKFHDGTSIDFIKDAYTINQIKRKKNDIFVYEHEFLLFDIAGLPLKENLPFNLGTVFSSYNASGKKISIDSPFHEFMITHLTKEGFPEKTYRKDTTHTLTSSYNYDSALHLCQEEGDFQHSYHFNSCDSIVGKNQETFTLNKKNQIISSGRFSYEYNAQGSRTRKRNNKNTLSYTYDALERLIALSSETIKIEFSYDFFGRRVKKTLFKKNFFGNFDLYDEIYYLYDGSYEIGSYNKEKKILELKVMADYAFGETGQAVMVELYGETYVPLHDTFGNIIALIDPSKRSIAESYTYSAFGETKICSSWGIEKTYSALKNPWLFQSKRYDEESSLYYFGARYLDPGIGAWITEDPSPICDSEDYYHFSKGNPLFFIDLYGFFSLMREDTPKKQDFNVVPLIEKSPQIKAPYLLPNHNYKTPSYTPYSASNIFENPGYHNPKNTRLFFINGINTSLKEAIEMQHSCSRALGCNVALFYNPSKELIFDLHEIARLHKNKQSSLVTNLKNCLMHEVSLGKQVVILAHSGGGLVAFNTTMQLSKQMQEKIHVITFGAAKYIPERKNSISENFVSSKDLISTSSNIWHYYLNSNNQAANAASRYTMIYLQPRSNSILKEHSFLGETYQSALSAKAKDLSQFLSR